MKSEYQELDVGSWPLVNEDGEFRNTIEATVLAGKMLHEAFYSKFQSHIQADQSEFTPFDAEAEKLTSKIIRKHNPRALIMGEELTPNMDVSGKDFYVIDGIDGTTNFARGIPICNFTMAKVEKGKTRFGTVYDFLHGELFYAVEGEGAYLNGEPIKIAERPFRESVITFAPLLNVRKGKGKYEQEEVSAVWAGMKEMSEISSRFFREFQSGGLELSWVASGKLDGYVSSWTNPWDLSAGVINVKEAGGIATNILGEDWQPGYWGVIAGSKSIHPEMLKTLQKYFENELSKNYDFKITDLK